MLANHFGTFFSENGDSVSRQVADLEKVWEAGHEKATQRAIEISKREPTLPKLDKFGPEFEQLLADMLIWDPSKRPQSAEVAERAKLLK